MIRFNGQTQQVMGDNTDPRLEQIISHHPRFPLAFWSFCKRDDGVDAFASLNAETVGLHDSTFESIESSDERSCLHVYDNAYVNKLDMSNGELHIMHGGYAGSLTVSGDAVVHISGHVGNLNIKDAAQVFLYDGAYVDWLHIYGAHAFVRIYRGAKVYAYDAPDPKSHTMVEDDACINKVMAGADTLAYFSSAPSETVLLKVKLRFKSKYSLMEFCKEATKSYEKYGRLYFGDTWISELHHKCIYDSCYSDQEGVDTVEFCADVASSAANTMIPSIRKWILARFPELSQNMTIWWKGVHELEALKTPVVCEAPERSIHDELKEAMEKATPAQWDKLLKIVFGDDTTAEGIPHRTHDRSDE